MLSEVKTAYWLNKEDQKKNTNNNRQIEEVYLASKNVLEISNVIMHAFDYQKLTYVSYANCKPYQFLELEYQL